MKRWHDDYKISLREWKKHRQTHIESNMRESARRIGKSPDEIDCECDKQVGRFRKMDAFDCGNPVCPMCSKPPKRLKHNHELRSDDSFKDQLKDLE